MHFLRSQAALASILMLTSLLTGALASPIDKSVVTDNPPHIFRRAMCTGTGPGVCNFGVSIIVDQMPGWDTVGQVGIFNRWCNQIGFVPNNWQPGQCFGSQLPYTVCVDEMDAPSRTITFRYAGQHISSRNGQCHCEATNGLYCWVSGKAYQGSVCCQCAFNC
jgi:hypothetical protein